MDTIIVPVILSGGDGTRLWPLSRQNLPKQFLKFSSELSLFQKTLKRLENITCGEVLVLTNERYQSLITYQLEEIHFKAKLILEPFKRDTAAAITLAAMKAKEIYPNHTNIKLLVLSSDHYIEDDNVFATLINASHEKLDGTLTSIVISPTEAHTGYGYIQRGEELDKNIYKIKQFHEKPTKEKAIEYLNSPDFYWNSGIFLFDLNVFLQELSKFAPDIYHYCHLALSKQSESADIITVDKLAFEECPSISIDYALMENTDKGALIILETKWSDVGSWDAFADLEECDEQNNVTIGNARTYKTKNSLVYSSGRLVTTLGVDNLAVIETNDAVAIINKDYLQENKVVVNDLASAKYKEVVDSPTMILSWGDRTYLENNKEYSVKKIVIHPEHSVSLSSGFWFMAIGNGMLELNGKTEEIVKGKIIEIPIDSDNQLTNSSENSIVLISFQSY